MNSTSSTNPTNPTNSTNSTNPILAIDIGNTAVTLGVLQKLKVLRSVSLEVDGVTVFRREAKQFLKAVKKKFPSLSSVIICSVSPRSFDVMLKILQGEFDDIRVIGRDVLVPIKNKYSRPKDVGQDRLVGAFAVKQLYGSPAIIVDLGTAITLDVISARGHYEGGIIVPGIKMSTESLFKKTALLPNIRTIHPPKSIIGKNTEESILSGIFYGYGAMCSGLIDQISKGLSRPPKVIMTGGYADILRKYMSRKADYIDCNLVLKGLSLLVEN